MMQKTKLGISVGLLGAAVYFLGLLSGYTVTALLVGYILLREENEWLRKTAVKAISIMLLFSAGWTIVGLLPNAVEVIDYIVGIFHGRFHISFLSNLEAAIKMALSIIEDLLLLGLGIKALHQGTIAVPIVDRMIERYMGSLPCPSEEQAAHK